MNVLVDRNRAPLFLAGQPTQASPASQPRTIQLCSPSYQINKNHLTFKLATRSAVSSRVKVEIWSTIVAIFGFVGAAASEFHLLCATKTDLAPAEARTERTANWRARDMVNIVEDGVVVRTWVRAGQVVVATGLYRISRLGLRKTENGYCG